MARSIDLKQYAYYRTGGSCETLYEPKSVQELADAVAKIHRSGSPYFLLGGGTNSLVLDEHYPGSVIVFAKMNRLNLRGSTLICGAGVENTAVAMMALQHGLAGAAWMNRLPGQIGGTVRMNARCYGGEISQICSKVTVVRRDGSVHHYAPKQEEVFRGYKDTVFMQNGDVIAEAELQLTPGDRAGIEQTMNFCETDRTKKGQFLYPSCGCVFKNDYQVGVSSGLLLDAAGAKTLKRGGAEVSPQHANFVYNKSASSRDILELSFAMRESVYAFCGVWMEYEMEVLGELAPDLKHRFEEIRPAQWDEVKLAPLRQKMPRS